MERVGRWQSLAAADWRKVAVVAASLLFAVLIAATLARLVWLVVGGPPAAVPAETESPAVVARPAPRFTEDMAQAWAMFGDAAAPVTAGTDETAPATNLSLQLLGIFSTGDARLAGAVIGERGKDGELYRIGAALPGGAVLEKVEASKVLLRRRGQLETLAFDSLASGGTNGGGSAGGSDAGAGLDMAGGFRSVKDRLSQPPTDDDGSEAGDAQSRARAVLANLSNDLRSNPDGVLAELGLRQMSAGQASGYMVGDGASAEAMRALGLRPGDVVLSVNGKALGNIRNDARLVDEVKSSGEARVEIRRGSQTFTVNYPL